MHVHWEQKKQAKHRKTSSFTEQKQFHNNYDDDIVKLSTRKVGITMTDWDLQLMIRK
jgi:hypothetical protein